MFPLNLFLNPVFLAGIAASAIPIIIHLTYRKKSQQVLFPSLKFIAASAKRTARRKRVTEAILLLLRCALISLLAVALAKPFFRTSGALGSSAAASIAIVMDNSYSMNARCGTTTRMELARQAAERILSGISPGRGRAGLFPTWAGSEEPGLGMMGRIEDARAALSSLRTTCARPDIAAAVRRAIAALDESKDANRELYILTDMQKATLKDIFTAMEGMSHKAIAVCVVPVAPQPVRNAAVVDMNVRSRGNLTGFPFIFEATVRNFDAEAAEIPVELTVDGERVATRAVKASGNGAATVTFTRVFDEPGWHEGFIGVPDDSLPDDDRRFFAVEAHGSLPVLAVETPSSRIEFRNSSYYLLRALDPLSGYGEKGKTSSGSGIQPKLIGQDRLRSEDLSKYRAVFWLNPSTPSVDAAAKLREFVESGGGLIVFPGESSRGPELTAVLGIAGKGGILPASIGERFGDPADRGKFSRIRSISLENAAMAPFRGVDRSEFESVHVYAGFDLILPKQGISESLADMDDGRPFLCRAAVGSGEVFLFCSNPDGVWTNFPLRQVFLPMMHILCYRTADVGGEAIRYTTGRVLLRAPGKEDWEGEMLRPGEQTPIPLSAKGGEAAAIEAERPGVYRIKWTAPRSAERWIAVNVDAGESDPETVPEHRLKKAFDFADAFFVAGDAETLEKILVRLREGVQLWNYILALVLATAVFECFFANRFGGRRRETPEEKGDAAAAHRRTRALETEDAIHA